MLFVGEITCQNKVEILLLNYGIEQTDSGRLSSAKTGCEQELVKLITLLPYFSSSLF